MSAAGEVQLEVLGRGEGPPAVGMRAGAGVLQVAILADLVSGLSIACQISIRRSSMDYMVGRGHPFATSAGFYTPPALLVSMGELSSVYTHNT